MEGLVFVLTLLLAASPYIVAGQEQAVACPVGAACQPGAGAKVQAIGNVTVESTKRVQSSETVSEEVEVATMAVPVMGRVVFLGDLYNAETDEALSGESLWLPATIEAKKIKTVLPSSFTDFYAADSLNEKMSKLDIDASLTLGFMAGMIEVEGSAGYLKDSKESENVITSVMTYKATTHAETLPQFMMGNDFPKVCESKATHIVTSITYGMEANFVFNKKIASDQSKEKIRGELSIAIKTIPTFEIKGSGKVEMSSSMKNNVQNMDVKIHGDFLLDKQPNTYEDTIAIYQALPTFLGTAPEYEKASKIEMKLTPITNYCSAGDSVMMKIKEEILNSVTTLMEKIERLKLSVKTLTLTGPATMYQDVDDTISTFLNSIALYDLEVKAQLRDILPKIRKSKDADAEEKLVNLKKHYAESQYSETKSEGFLSLRRREMKMLEYIIDPKHYVKPKIHLLDNADATDIKQYFKQPNVILLTYYVLPDPVVTRNFLSAKPDDEGNSWFQQDSVVANLGAQFLTLVSFAEANQGGEHGFLVALKRVGEGGDDVNYKFDAMHGGSPIANYVIPDAPVALKSTHVTESSVTFFGIALAQEGSKTGVRITYSEIPKEKSNAEGEKKSEEEVTKKLVKEVNYQDGSIQNMKIENLSPNTKYKFVVQHVTQLGVSPPAKDEHTVKTKASSVPTLMKSTDLTNKGLRVKWFEPSFTADQATIEGYYVTVADASKQVVQSATKTATELSHTIRDLTPGEQYTITVKAIVHVTGESGKLYGTSQEITIQTLPNPPKTPTVAVTDDTAAVSWSAGNVPTGGKIVGYSLMYYEMDSSGLQIISGTEIEKVVDHSTLGTGLTKLLKGATFGAAVKMRTDKGDSDYSSRMIFKISVSKDIGTFQKDNEEKILDGIKTSVDTKEASVQALLQDMDRLNGDNSKETAVEDIKETQTHNAIAIASTYTATSAELLQWDETATHRRDIQARITTDTSERGDIDTLLAVADDKMWMEIDSFKREVYKQLEEITGRQDKIPEWFFIGMGTFQSAGFQRSTTPFGCQQTCIDDYALNFASISQSVHYCECKGTGGILIPAGNARFSAFVRYDEGKPTGF